MASHGHAPSNAPASSSSHRLATVSASQTLQKLRARGSRAVSTGLSQLDQKLLPYGLPPGADAGGGGWVRGKVTEVYGPPGVGKTAFGTQAAANALCAGNKVCWIDAAIPLDSRRLHQVLLASLSQKQQNTPRTGQDPLSLSSSSSSSSSPPNPSSLDELLSHFHHYTCPTLAHLLALFVHSPASFPPPNTSLIVIDSLSTLFDNAYPRNADGRDARNRNDQTRRWATGRKFTVMNDLIMKLGRVAALHDIALLVTCQTITRIRGGSRALLVPAITGLEWDSGISTRLVLFRDRVPAQGNHGDANGLRRARFAGVVKLNGLIVADEGGVGNVVPFTVEGKGLCDLTVSAEHITPPAVHLQQASPARPPKRRFTEIADSEDEDSDELYGWAEDDEVAAEGLTADEGGGFGNDEPTAEAPTELHSQSTSLQPPPVD